MKSGLFVKKGLSIILLFPVVCGHNAAAIEAGTEDLLSMDIESLMKIKVYSTTKTQLDINKSPGIVRVFSQHDFERFGFKTLKDVMTAVPGIQLAHSYRNHTNLWVRGIQTRYNSKLLLLIDGVPIRENYYGHFDIDKGMSLDHVERVEVINGPGSVLYGANAFAGVISVTTKTHGRSISYEVAAQEGYGYSSPAPDSINEKSHDRRTYARQLTLEGDADINDATHLYGIAQLAEGEPFNPKRSIDEGARYQHDLDESKRFFMGKLSFDDLTLTVSDNKFDIPSVYDKAFKDYQQVHRPQYISLAYRSQYSSNNKLNSQIWYENYDHERTKKEYEDTGSGNLEEEKESFIYSRMYGIDIDYTWNVAHSHVLTTGISWLHDESVDRIKEHENTGAGWGPWEYALSKDISRDSVGLFLQDNWDISDNISLTSGIRYNKLSDFDDHVNFRLGLTGFTDSGYYGKFLLGSAFRTPNYREYAKQGVENFAIEPEQLITTELQIGSAFSRGDANVTLYYNMYDDFINDILVPEDGVNCNNGSDQYYTNFDNRKILGLEFSSSYYPTEKLALKLNASSIIKATEENGSMPADVMAKGGSCNSFVYESGKQDIKLLSKYLFSVLASYQFNHRYQGGINIQYASERKTPDNYHNNVSNSLKLQSSDNPDSYVLVDVFGKINFNKNASLDLGVKNLFDENVYHPRLSDVEDYDVELPGRRIELKLKYKF